EEERVVEHIIETSNRLADLLLGKALLEDQHGTVLKNWNLARHVTSSVVRGGEHTERNCAAESANRLDRASIRKACVDPKNHRRTGHYAVAVKRRSARPNSRDIATSAPGAGSG